MTAESSSVGSLVSALVSLLVWILLIVKTSVSMLARRNLCVHTGPTKHPPGSVQCMRNVPRLTPLVVQVALTAKNSVLLSQFVVNPVSALVKLWLWNLSTTRMSASVPARRSPCAITGSTNRLMGSVSCMRIVLRLMWMNAHHAFMVKSCVPLEQVIMDVVVGLIAL